MISADTLAFAVRALLRIGRAAGEAHEQAVRDEPIQLLNLLVAEPFDADQELFNFFWINDPELTDRVENGDLKDLWVDGRVRDAAARARLIEEYARITGSKPNLVSVAGDGTMLEQWASGKGPPAPMARVALAFADVALDFVASKPGILGIGGNGERLITALGANIRAMFPDIDNPATWQGEAAKLAFAERAAAVILNAGLKTIADNADVVVRQEQYSKLLRGVLAPAVAAFEAKPLQRPSLERARDLLLGPMASAALKVLQDDPKAFLGDAFDPASTALGAVTEAVLGQAAAGKPGDLVTQTGLLQLYRAALGVAVAQPKLFLKQDGAKSDAARKIVSAAAAALQQAPAPFSGDAGIAVAAAVVDAFKDNLRPFVGGASPWEDAASDLLTQVLSGVSTGLRNPQERMTFEVLFGKEKAVDLVTIVLKQVAKTPQMLPLASGRKEVAALISVIASAAVSDNGRLLGAGDWTAVAEAAAAELVRNPLRLIDPAAQPEAQILSLLLTRMLTAAAKNVPAGQRDANTMLFGETLRQGIAVAIRETAGNSANAALHLDDLQALVELINQSAAQNPGQIGAREWLFLFERNVTKVLDAGMPAGLTAAALLAELQSPR